ncbi:MAG: hypothetical protein WC601_06720 [Desulfotomaculaceae bacterium]
MANKNRGYVEIELDKVRTLRYNLNALAELEDKIGVPLSALNNLSMGMKQIRAFLWAGLIHEDPDLDEKTVGELVDVDTMDYISQKIGEAFQGATRKN